MATKPTRSAKSAKPTVRKSGRSGTSARPGKTAPRKPSRPATGARKAASPKKPARKPARPVAKKAVARKPTAKSVKGKSGTSIKGAIKSAKKPAAQAKVLKTKPAQS